MNVCDRCGLLLYGGGTCDRCQGTAQSDPYDGAQFDDVAARYPRDNVVVVFDAQPEDVPEPEPVPVKKGKK